MRPTPILPLLLTLLLISDKAMAQFWDGIRAFTASVYEQKVQDEHGNILISPLSAELVLALAALGAKNETEKEIRNSLYLPESAENLKEVCKMALEALNTGEQYTLRAANKIYVDQKFPVKPEFRKLATDVFKAGVENGDFSKSAETANSINKWVETQTENKIRNLISPDSLSTEMAICLINAIYFKGIWKSLFDKRGTKASNFWELNGNVIKVDTMFKKDKFAYYENSNLDAKFLEMRFKGKDASLIIALPNQKNGITKLEKQMGEILGPHVFSFETVTVAIPKFKIETTIDFKRILMNMGIHRAFSSSEADFSGISDKKGAMWIGEVLQKTYIDVDEEGAEAAAATFVGAPRMMPLYVPPPKEFIADHPFVFYIQVKNIVLFVGRVHKPTH